MRGKLSAPWHEYTSCCCHACFQPALASIHHLSTFYEPSSSQPLASSSLPLSCLNPQDAQQRLDRVRLQQASPAGGDRELQVFGSRAACHHDYFAWQCTLPQHTRQQLLQEQICRMHTGICVRCPACHLCPSITPTAGPFCALVRVQAECAALRNMINCNVCHQRQKDVVITKCWHMFCNHCIQRNLGGWLAGWWR